MGRDWRPEFPPNVRDYECGMEEEGDCEEIVDRSLPDGLCCAVWGGRGMAG